MLCLSLLIWFLIFLFFPFLFGNWSITNLMLRGFFAFVYIRQRNSAEKMKAATFSNIKFALFVNHFSSSLILRKNLMHKLRKLDIYWRALPGAPITLLLIWLIRASLTSFCVKQNLWFKTWGSMASVVRVERNSSTPALLI